MKNTKLFLLFLSALLLGVCIGFLANNAIIRSRIRHYSRIPENLPEHITQRLTERLDLDPAQQERVRTVLYAYSDRMDEARTQSNNLLSGVLNEMRGEIFGLLTAEQQVKYEKVIAERNRIMSEKRDLMRAYPPEPPSHSPPPRAP